MPFVEIRGEQLEYAWIGRPSASAPTIVFLHEGLGCLEMWKGFPQRIALATGCATLVYSRAGYGRSGGSLAGRGVDYLHAEAFASLPELLAALDVRKCLLFGHSDGASIALLFATRPTVELAGLILEAPHVFVEDITLAGVRDAGEMYRRTAWRDKLRRYHGARSDEVFDAWNEVWLSPEFHNWNIEQHLAGITCPILLLQGEDDEYGSHRQLDSIAERSTGRCEIHLLKDCGHVVHRDAADQVERLTQAFVSSRRTVA